MWDQEKKHLQDFQELLKNRRVRPTLFMPLWNVAGFVLGAGTALMGKEAAMACTAAVEEVIGEHYNRQLRNLMAGNHADDEELLETIRKCRDEELEHLEIGQQSGADQAPFYGSLTEVIKQGCKVAIWLSERI
jgi:ubiquinone biosynthesis monooxygenase Coq7